MEKVGSERDELCRIGWDRDGLGRIGSKRDELRRVGKGWTGKSSSWEGLDRKEN